MPRSYSRWRAGWAKARKAVRAPSFPELFFSVLLLAAFGRTAWREGLLYDGDPGWHIRTGEFILQNGAVPQHDLFSFTRPGESWFAWEWLADVIFAKLHAWGGLEALVAFAAVALCGSAALLLCWLLRRGVGLWIALSLTLAVASASSIHNLARPHLFSLLLFTVALWVLDEDRRRPSALVWSLVPLAALWANLHGGFVAWLGTLGVLLAATACERNWAALHRYGWLTGMSAAATLINPYGWRLHDHIVRYLGSSWIMDNVQEFQSPRIRSENMQVFAVLLLVGVALASRTLLRRHWFEGMLVLVWALASLRSARHIPLYAVAAAPVIASEWAAWWAAVAARSHGRSLARIFWDTGQELGQARRWGLWAPVLGTLTLSLVWTQAHMTDFPVSQFPVAAVTGNLDRLAPRAGMPRVLTSDQWADYLIYRLYPRQRVFFDGRSDFYGPAIGADYKALLEGTRRWPDLLARYGFDMALLPLDWPLGSIIEHDPHWLCVYQDSSALLFVRRPPELKGWNGNAECTGG